jgi:hypothetical protein
VQLLVGSRDSLTLPINLDVLEPVAHDDLLDWISTAGQLCVAGGRRATAHRHGIVRTVATSSGCGPSPQERHPECGTRSEVHARICGCPGVRFTPGHPTGWLRVVS